MADGERDHDDARDELPPLGARSESGEGELDHNRATDDEEEDRTRSSDGERTIDTNGINVIVMGDR